MVTDDLIADIRRYLDEAGVAPARLAADAGLHPNALRDVRNENWNPTLETLRKIEAVLPPEFRSRAA